MLNSKVRSEAYDGAWLKIRAENTTHFTGTPMCKKSLVSYSKSRKQISMVSLKGYTTLTRIFALFWLLEWFFCVSFPRPGRESVTQTTKVNSCWSATAFAGLCLHPVRASLGSVRWEIQLDGAGHKGAQTKGFFLLWQLSCWFCRRLHASELVELSPSCSAQQSSSSLWWYQCLSKRTATAH